MLSPRVPEPDQPEGSRARTHTSKPPAHPEPVAIVLHMCARAQDHFYGHTASLTSPGAPDFCPEVRLLNRFEPGPPSSTPGRVFRGKATAPSGPEKAQASATGDPIKEKQREEHPKQAGGGRASLPTGQVLSLQRLRATCQALVGARPGPEQGACMTYDPTLQTRKQMQRDRYRNARKAARTSSGVYRVTSEPECQKSGKNIVRCLPGDLRARMPEKRQEHHQVSISLSLLTWVPTLKPGSSVKVNAGGPSPQDPGEQALSHPGLLTEKHRPGVKPTVAVTAERTPASSHPEQPFLHQAGLFPEKWLHSSEIQSEPISEVEVSFPACLKLEGSKCKGQLLIFGATNWDLIGRKEVPKQQAAYRNLGQNLWGPHRYGCLSGVRVRTVVSGSCAAHSLLITTEGKLWSWGRNEKGQLGHGDTKRVEAPRLVEGLSHEVIVSAACGRNHTLALTETGSVFAFGENKMGQLGLGNQTDAVPSPAQIMYNGQPITKMACGAEFSMIMDCKGNLYSFGCPEYGQLGHNSDGKFIARAQRIEYDCELVPRRVAIFIEKTKDGQILPVPNVVVRDVACGANHTLVLDSQKRVFSWGFGGYGRLGHAEQKDEMVPRLVKLFDFPGRGASQIYAGYTCSFAVSEVGGLFFWGATNTSRESTMYPKAVQDLCGWRIRSLACGKSSIIVAADESTISWGPSPTFGELGYGDHKPKSSTAAQEVKTLDGIFTEQVAMGYSHSLVIARDESEAEKEKIRKLPEYNPRTL
ncbi:hypothetical protein E5288_WYG016931 [Bos mutus]|uniref:Protein RCC2 n=3 Tax=Bovidae TaxID=9895 RepID=A0A6B0S330_9CETA|nr:hypothetical protein [Bos mutus]